MVKFVSTAPFNKLTSTSLSLQLYKLHCTLLCTPTLVASPILPSLCY